jgi:two-component system LytT family response regulator
MKPFSKQRFDEALAKVYERAQQKQDPSENIQDLAEKVKSDGKILERIFVKTGTRIDVIPVTDIVHIQAEDDYVEIVTEEKKYLKKETMNYLENSLPSELFIRVHRSSIVNVNYILKLERYGKESYIVILKDGSKVNVSKSRVKELKEQLGF